MLLRNHRGQGAIEAALALPVLITAFMAFGMILHRGLIYYWADYQLHEALLCRQLESPSVCQNRLEQSLKYLLLPGSRLSVSLSRAHGQVEVSFHSQLNPKLRIEKQITWR